MLDLDVPKPSPYLKHSIVEDVATECNKLYRQAISQPKGFPVEVIPFADFELEVTIEWAKIEEPEYTVVFAKCCPDPKSEGRYVVTVNSRYRELFEVRPDLLNACLAHEIGHLVLRHHYWHARPQNMDSLFPDINIEPRCLHDSSWKPLAFTKQDMNEWCLKAFQGDEEARKRLVQLQDRLEPDWMFWQTERFSMCFLIPRDRLLQLLNDGSEVSSWLAIRRLAEPFGVSSSMMRTRLVKMGAVVIRDGKPETGPLLQQRSILRTH
jgi:hypothetical protein